MTDTYANISWLLQTTAGFIDTFYVSYRLTSSNTWMMATTSLPNNTRSYQLTGLTPGTAYVVGVATKNALVNPSNYTTTTFTTAGEVTSIYGMVCSYPTPIPPPPISVTPSVTLTSSSVSVTSGTSFTLTCIVGTGYLTTVVWSKDGSTSLPQSAMVNGSSSLVFTNPQPGDSGGYVCGFLGSTGPSSLAFMVSING